jgi:hypothetical protein
MATLEATLTAVLGVAALCTKGATHLSCSQVIESVQLKLNEQERLKSIQLIVASSSAAARGDVASGVYL